MQNPATAYLLAGIAITSIAWRSRWRCLALVLLGAAYGNFRAEGALAHVMRGDTPAAVRARLQIDSLPTRRDGVTRFDAIILAAEPRVPMRRVRITWFHAPSTLRAAEIWGLTLKLKAPRGWRNPGGFDAELQWLREGIDALGAVDANSPCDRIDLARSTALLLQMRERISRMLGRWLEGHPSAGIIQGLAVGDTSTISPEDWRVFRSVGITHLMAISGSHVGFFGLLAASLARNIWRLARGRVSQQGCQRVCAFSAVLASAFYALLSGFSIPTQRTVVMIAVAGAARIAARSLGPEQLLSLALVAVLLWDPTAPLTPGFWLSFGTVAWLFSSQRDSSGTPVWRTVRTQLGVTLILLPVTIVCFGQASLIAPIVNLICIPATEVAIVPATLGAVGISPLFPGIARWAIQHVGSILDHAMPLLERASAWDGAKAWWPHIPLGIALLGLAAVACLFLVPGVAIRAMACAALASLCIWKPAQLAAGDFDVSVLEAGDALICVLLTRNRTLVYFAGSGFARGNDVAESVLLPYLRAMGRSRVDLLIVSRTDASHAHGIASLFREMPVSAMVGGGDPEAPCLDQQRWNYDGVRIEVLNPFSDSVRGKDASCVVWIGTERAAALIAGEVTSAAEQRMVSVWRLPRPALLVVPDHGSQHGSSRGFILAMRARWAVICASHANRFGYPRSDVIERWRASGAMVRRISNEGALEWHVRNGQPQELLAGERLRHVRYWTAP